VQKHITVGEHAHLQYAVIVNSKFWNGLAPDIRAGLDKAMKESTDYTNGIAQQENKDALEEIKKSGKSQIHVLTADQRKVWRDAMAPTWEWAVSRVGKEAVDLLKKATGA
jgi:C4-dicarboxylate-binding protein DctP